jgi:hypothetical protein
MAAETFHRQQAAGDWRVTEQDILAAAVPRSGSTLSCWLLNKVPNVVALPEPMDMSVLTEGIAIESVIENIAKFIAQTRASILTEKRAPARVREGQIVSNLYEPPRSDGSLRRHDTEPGWTTIDKPLQQDFVLVIKQPAMFLALIPELAAAFPIYATVRHPVEVLASWNTIESNFMHGRLPMAERFAPELVQRLDPITDGVDRQIALLCWCFEQVLMLPPDRIVKYETMVSTGGAGLATIVPEAARLAESIERYSVHARYPSVPIDALARRLRETGGPFDALYPDL